MSTKPERPLPDDREEAEEQDKTIIRVKRGALRRFDQLTRKSTNLPVEVKWDRRTGDERRASPEASGRERRSDERRQSPPFTWDAAEFVVEGDRSSLAPEPSDAPGPARKKR